MDLSPENVYYNQGRDAYYNGAANPYDRYTYEYKEWEEGFFDAEDEDIHYPDTYIGDEYYSGTGELIGDDSYIDYLNHY